MSDTQRQRQIREKKARSRHTRRYWQRHDRDMYTCPECGRQGDEVVQFEVHHRDGNPMNGDDENLVGLCRACHYEIHGRGPPRSLAEWKADFKAELLGGEAV